MRNLDRKRMRNMSNKALFDEKQHFGLRKFSTGLASVLLATTLFTAGHSEQVKADTVDDDANHAEDQQNLPDNDTKDFKTQDDVKQVDNQSGQKAPQDKSDKTVDDSANGSIADDLAELNAEADGKTVDKSANDTNKDNSKSDLKPVKDESDDKSVQSTDDKAADDKSAQKSNDKTDTNQKSVKDDSTVKNDDKSSTNAQESQKQASAQEKDSDSKSDSLAKTVEDEKAETNAVSENANNDQTEQKTGQDLSLKTQIANSRNSQADQKSSDVQVDEATSYKIAGKATKGLDLDTIQKESVQDMQNQNTPRTTQTATIGDPEFEGKVYTGESNKSPKVDDVDNLQTLDTTTFDTSNLLQLNSLNTRLAPLFLSLYSSNNDGSNVDYGHNSSASDDGDDATDPLNPHGNIDETQPMVTVGNVVARDDPADPYATTISFKVSVGNIAALDKIELNAFPIGFNNTNGFTFEYPSDNTQVDITYKDPVTGKPVLLGTMDIYGTITINHTNADKLVMDEMKAEGEIYPTNFTISESFRYPDMHVDESDGQINNHPRFHISFPANFQLKVTPYKGSDIKTINLGNTNVNGAYLKDAVQKTSKTLPDSDGAIFGYTPMYDPVVQSGYYTYNMKALANPPWWTDEAGKPYEQVEVSLPFVIDNIGQKTKGNTLNYDWSMPLHLINNSNKKYSDQDIQRLLRKSLLENLYTKTEYGTLLRGDENQANVTKGERTYYIDQINKDTSSTLADDVADANRLYVTVTHTDDGTYRNYHVSIRYDGDKPLYRGTDASSFVNLRYTIPVDINLANSKGLPTARNNLLHGKPTTSIPTFGNFVDSSYLDDLHNMKLHVGEHEYSYYDPSIRGMHSISYKEATYTGTPMDGWSDNNNIITMIRQHGNYDADLEGKPATSHLILEDEGDSDKVVYTQTVHGTVGDEPGLVDVDAVNNFMSQNGYVLGDVDSIPPAIDMTAINTPDVIIKVYNPKNKEQRHLTIHYLDMDDDGKEIESLKDTVPLHILWFEDDDYYKYGRKREYYYDISSTSAMHQDDSYDPTTDPFDIETNTFPDEQKGRFYDASARANSQGYYVVDDAEMFRKKYNIDRDSDDAHDGSSKLTPSEIEGGLYNIEAPNNFTPSEVDDYNDEFDLSDNPLTGCTGFHKGNGYNGYLDPQYRHGHFRFDWSTGNFNIKKGQIPHGYANYDIYLHVRHIDDSQIPSKEETVTHTYVVKQHVPEPSMESNKYSKIYSQDKEIFRQNVEFHKSGNGPWTIDHYYAFDNQGNMADLGKATFTQNAAGEWGFWDVFEKYQHSQYGVQANELFTNIGAGPVGFPEYDITNDDPAGGTVHFGGDNSWFTIDVNSPSDIENLKGKTTTATVSYNPTEHHNMLYLKPNNADQGNVQLAYREPDAKKLLTDSTGTFSFNDASINDPNTAKAVNTLNKMAYIDHVEVGKDSDPDHDIVLILTNNDGTFSVNTFKHGMMSLDQYNEQATRNHWALQNIDPVSVTSNGKVKAGILTRFTVADQNIYDNGTWTYEQPDITIYYDKMADNKNQEGQHDDSNVSDKITIHYIIPEQVADATGQDNDDTSYSINLKRDQYTTVQDYPYTIPVTDYTDPIAWDENGNPIAWGTIDETFHDYETESNDTGWYDTDGPDDDSNTVSIDDITGYDLSNDPLVYDESTLPKHVAGYHMVIYYKDASGNPVYINDGQLVEDGYKHYYAPWYGQGLSEQTDDIGQHLIDPSIGRDIYVSYVADNAQKQIQYIDAKDYPEGQEHVVSQRTVSGPEGSEVDQQIDKYMPNGYVYDTDYEKPEDIYTFEAEEDKKPTKVYVMVKDKVSDDKEASQVHYTINFVNETDLSTVGLDFTDTDGKTTESKTINLANGENWSKTFTFAHHTETNPITGEVDVDNWTNDQSVDKAVINLPEGYTASVDGAVLKSIPAQTFSHDSPDKTINIVINKADQTQQLEFVHMYKDGTEEDLGSAGSVTGSLGQAVVANLNPPNGWVISHTQTDPSLSITDYGSDSNNSGQAIVSLSKDKHVIKINVESPDVLVLHTDPKNVTDMMPDPHQFENYPGGVAKDDLNRTITETVEFDGPEGSSVQKQTITFYRDALVHTADGSVDYIDHNSNNASLGTNWVGMLNGQNAGIRSDVITQPVSIGKIDGYTPIVQVISGGNVDYDQDGIHQIHVNPESENILIRVRYVKNAVGNRVIFVDDDATMSQVGFAQEVGNSGATLVLPSGYEIADNSGVAQTITNGGNVSWSELQSQYGSHTGDPSVITIHVREKTRDVSDTDPDAKLDVKRQVVIHSPNGKITSVIVTAQMRRQAIYNEVTKQTHYGVWKQVGLPVKVYQDGTEIQGGEDTYLDTNDQEYKNWKNKGAIVIPAIRVPDIDGYDKAIDNTNTNGVNVSNDYVPLEVIMTPDQTKTYKNNIGTETDPNNQDDVNNQGIDIKQNKVISVHYNPDEYEMTYIYVDVDNGVAVKGDSITGEAGETYDLENSLPDGYRLASGQSNISSKWTLGGKRNVTNVIYVKKITMQSA